MITLTFLIPVYKRTRSSLEALKSVSHQINNSHQVYIHVQDDGTPGLDFNGFKKSILSIYPQTLVTQNSSNLGMSANILDMVKACKSDFCTVLTDDDQLCEGALGLMLEQLTQVSMAWPDTTSLFVPRYSYNESGSLISVSCFNGTRPMPILSSPKTAIKYCANGYILTGLIFQTQAINTGEWEKHIDNAFFPVIYFGNLLLEGDSFYLDAEWFRHTVMNHCHWDSWGSSDEEQQIRLCRDYLDSIDIVHRQARIRTHSMIEDLSLMPGKIVALRDRLIEKRDLVRRRLWRIVPPKLWRDPAFLVAILLYCYFMARTYKASRA